MSLKSAVELFCDREKSTPNAPFLRQPFGDKWEIYTYGEAGQMVRKMAAGLKKMGLKENAHVGLVSKNCREWVIADLAIAMAGYVSVPFFATLTGQQISQVLELGDVDLLIIGKIDIPVWKDMKTGIPSDMPCIKMYQYDDQAKIDRGTDWQELLNNNAPLQAVDFPDINSLWTIIFTSGTTGTPKGVMLRHAAQAELLEAVRKDNFMKMDFGGNNRFLSFLPLNHIAERVVIEGACLAYGGVLSFAESLDTFAKNLSETNPTVFFAVPRIWKKFQMGILSKMPQSRLNLLLKIPIVSGIIKKKLQDALGLRESRSNLSGAAAISQELKDWFGNIGIPITEGYGMTENCAACTVLDAADYRPGSVGKPQPGVELKIVEETGEVCMRAPYVMDGYYKSPDKTAEVIKDGWLHTGDQGRIDEDGYLYLTGRVKDTFKTAKGKYIVPSPIEFKFANNKDIEQLCLVGLGMPQPMLIVFPSELGQAKERAELIESLEASLGAANKELASYKKISTIIVAKEAFSVENGMLTPTLKVKRPQVNNRYLQLLEGWHSAKAKVVFE
ncbi:MAG: AMP-binding protein [Bacteroidota bacterium]